MDAKQLLQQRSPGVLYRVQPGSRDAHPQLLREFLGLANSGLQGPCGIVFGVERAPDGSVHIFGLDDRGWVEMEALQRMLTDAVEPQLELTLSQGEIDGKRIAAITFGACPDPPYVAGPMAPTPVRRGECWVREGNALREAQRADFDRMYAGKLAGITAVAVGIGDDPLCELAEVTVPPAGPLPSEIAMAKLREAIAARRAAEAMMGRDDSRLARLAFARLYGADVPYEQRGLDTLVQLLHRAREDYREADLHWRFEERAIRLNLTVCNQGEEALQGAVLEVVLPLAPGITVASRVYPPPGGKTPAADWDPASYPSVRTEGDCVRVRAALGTLPPAMPVCAFGTPLRLAVDARLRGRKMAMRYTLVAQRLSVPVRGRLKVKFRS